LTAGLLIGLAVGLQLALVWLPTVTSVGLSFTSWDGVGGLDSIKPVGLQNYVDLVTVQPEFWRAVSNTVIWLFGLLLVATPLGVLLAVALDRRLRGAAFYEGALYLPVVLSMALIGIIWQLQYAPEQGFINNVLGTTRQDNLIDWLGDRNLNIWAALVPAIWRHVGYVTLLYLAGLRSVDPHMAEAASIDGATGAQAFRFVTFPLMRPVNVVIVVITVIEALRAFDIVYVLNGGRNGLELLTVLIVNSILGEATRIGFGSAVATLLLVLAIPPIVIYLRRAFARQTEAAA